MDSKYYKYHFFIKSIFFLIMFLLLSSCDSDSGTAVHDLDDLVDTSKLTRSIALQKEVNVFYFGFDLRSSPQEDARQYLPFLQYLENATGYKFRLQFTPKNNTIVNALGENKVQFAAIGADSFIRANKQYGVIPLVRGLNLQNKAEYQSVFVVMRKSKLKNLDDIRGKHLAFGSRTSTQGHLIPLIELNKAGITLKNLASYTYTGSHFNCANSVISAKTDVCAMQDTMARNMVKQGLLRIIHISDYFPSSGIAANKNIHPEVIQRVKQALLDFQPQGKDKASLYHWDRTEMPRGFVSASVSDYDELYKWGTKLGFLQSAKVNK